MPTLKKSWNSGETSYREKGKVNIHLHHHHHTFAIWSLQQSVSTTVMSQQWYEYSVRETSIFLHSFPSLLSSFLTFKPGRHCMTEVILRFCVNSTLHIWVPERPKRAICAAPLTCCHNDISMHSILRLFACHSMWKGNACGGGRVRFRRLHAWINWFTIAQIYVCHS